MMALVGLFLTHYFCVVMLGDATKVLPREAQLSSAAVNTQARKACPGSQNRVSETGGGGARLQLEEMRSGHKPAAACTPSGG